MAPTKEELDGALSEIKSILANREAMIAKAYANHPDPNAWSLHFINCLSMIVQGPLSKVEDSDKSDGSVSLAKAVKRRRVDDGEVIPQGISDNGRVFESEEDTTYRFKGPAAFRVETEGSEHDLITTYLSVHGHTKVFVQDALGVEVERQPVAEEFTFAKTVAEEFTFAKTVGRGRGRRLAPKKAPAVKTETDSKEL